jgi:hypothetical protein
VVGIVRLNRKVGKISADRPVSLPKELAAKILTVQSENQCAAAGEIFGGFDAGTAGYELGPEQPLGS